MRGRRLQWGRRGTTGVRAGTWGLSAPIQRPVALTNGMMEGVGLIGGRTDIMAGGGPLVGRGGPPLWAWGPAGVGSLWWAGGAHLLGLGSRRRGLRLSLRGLARPNRRVG